MKLKLILIAVLQIVTGSYAQNIPQYLLPCYRGNNTQPFAGSTKQMLVTLIRKVEDSNPNLMDIRTMSSNLLHRMKLDGIQKAPGVSETQFVTPYRANGIMTPKFNLLRRLIPETPGIIPFESSLTEFELCLLHRLISYSVEPYERGDETRTCPLNQMPAVEAPWITGGISLRNETFFNGGTTKIIRKFGRGVSKCPHEIGVIRTHNYGSIVPGTFITSIAAGLQPQTVQISEFVGSYTEDKYAKLETMDIPTPRAAIQRLLRNLNTIDNKYAAGLSGDLAEVCVYQTPYVGTNFTIGITGNWNDTHFPRVRFLEENHHARWEFTEPEILSGLDSLFISHQIANWISRARRIRLSQIVDMYYSPRGIPGRAIETSNHISKTWRGGSVDQPSLGLYSEGPNERFSVQDEISNACQRSKIIDSIDVNQLKEETYNFAQVLQFSTATFYMSDEVLRTSCNRAVDMFIDKAKILLQRNPVCNQISNPSREPEVDINLVVDGSRTDYENLQLINHISEISEVSRFGSLLQVIHGTTGQVMANRTNSSAFLFQQLQNFTDRGPTTISLSNALQTIFHNLTNRTAREQEIRKIVAPSHVILIFCQGDRVTSNDFLSAQRMINGTFQRFPDLYFIFVTNDRNTFMDLTKGITPPSHWIGDTEKFNNLIFPEHFTIIQSSSKDPDDFTEKLEKELRRIPKRIVVPYCMDEEQREAKRRQNILVFADSAEEYISPNQEIVYRISPYYFRYSKLVVMEFNGVGYGDLTVCKSRVLMQAPDECKSLKGADSVFFNITQPCVNVFNCPSLYFSVAVDVSLLRCTENDCRYPDQVRYNIRHQGLNCEDDPGASSVIRSNFILLLFTAFIYFCFNDLY